SALAAGLWLLSSAAGRSTLNAAGAGDADSGSAEPQFLSFGKALSEFPSWVIDVLPGQSDDRTLVWWAVLWLIGMAMASRTSARPLLLALRLRVRLLAPVCVAAYFMMPASYDWIWPISARFALLSTIFAIPLLPRLSM